jgi:nitroimidazol reductase NimA-like FMN-containing flavoprotein (pyridoxamine 5'-phosphate oxidase superfamily)
VHATHDAINFFVLPLMKICLGMQATGTPRASRGAAKGGVTVVTEEMLSQKNVESVLLRGKKVAEQTNAEKLERFAHELVKERDRRRTSAITPAAVKQQPSTPGSDATPTASYSNLVSQMLTSIM